MSLFRKRIKVTKEELAEVLGHWIEKRLENEQIKETAIDFGIDTNNQKDLNSLVDELFDLNMWIVVFTCERVFKNISKRDECLDVFHHLIYERLSEGEETDYRNWILNLAQKYMGYNEAIKSAQPILVIANVVNTNIFEDLRKDPFLQMRIGNYIMTISDVLEKALKQYKLY